jgi:hypothetical protein
MFESYFSYDHNLGFQIGIRSKQIGIRSKQIGIHATGIHANPRCLLFNLIELLCLMFVFNFILNII